MTLAKHRYTIHDDVLTAHLAGEAVLLHMRTRKYFRLNETAAAIWKQLEGGAGTDEAAANLCTEFDVGRDEAERALAETLEQLTARELIVPNTPREA